MSYTSSLICNLLLLFSISLVSNAYVDNPWLECALHGGKCIQSGGKCCGSVYLGDPKVCPKGNVCCVPGKVTHASKGGGSVSICPATPKGLGKELPSFPVGPPIPFLPQPFGPRSQVRPSTPNGVAPLGPAMPGSSNPAFNLLRPWGPSSLVPGVSVVPGRPGGVDPAIPGQWGVSPSDPSLRGTRPSLWGTSPPRGPDRPVGTGGPSEHSLVRPGGSVGYDEPGRPGEPGGPGRPGRPGGPGGHGEPGAPGGLRGPGGPGEPGLPGGPSVHLEPSVVGPGGTGWIGAPGRPGGTSWPGEPGRPGGNGWPGGPGRPGGNGWPRGPGRAGGPDVPVVPGMLSIPGRPGWPGRHWDLSPIDPTWPSGPGGTVQTERLPTPMMGPGQAFLCDLHCENDGVCNLPFYFELLSPEPFCLCREGTEGDFCEHLCGSNCPWETHPVCGHASIYDGMNPGTTFFNLCALQEAQCYESWIHKLYDGPCHDLSCGGYNCPDSCSITDYVDDPQRPGCKMCICRHPLRAPIVDVTCNPSCPPGEYCIITKLCTLCPLAPHCSSVAWSGAIDDSALTNYPKGSPPHGKGNGDNGQGTDENYDHGNGGSYGQDTDGSYDQGTGGSYIQGTNGSYAQGTDGSYAQGTDGSYSQSTNGSYVQGPNGNYDQGNNGIYGQGTDGSYGQDTGGSYHQSAEGNYGQGNGESYGQGNDQSYGQDANRSYRQSSDYNQGSSYGGNGASDFVPSIYILANPGHRQG